MGKLRFQISVSLDGYVAGPNPTIDEPLGVGGEALHEWAFRTEAWLREHGRSGGEQNASSRLIDEIQANVGASIMGRNMFGPGPGPWDENDPWQGWWGDEPPFHHPVFVLTHHPRPPLELVGTTFTFVTEGIESALEQARATAGDRDVQISGGAQAVQQYLSAGLVDEFDLHTAPIFLGGGTRLFENVGALEVEQLRAIEGDGVVHVKYRVVR